MDLTSVFCLALAIAYEAGNQPVSGQYRVAHVVKNRVQSPRYPDTVCKVVFQDGQFSFVRHIHKMRRVSQKTWDRAVRIAEDVLHGSRKYWIPALYYYNPRAASPRWAKSFKVVVRDGDHVFLN